MCLARHENWRFTNNERESMRGGLRLAMVVWTAGLVLGPAPLAAQSAPATTTNTPAADAVGPKELQNFSLSGTVTRAADQPPQRTTTATSPGRPAAETRTTSVSAGAPLSLPARKTAEIAPPVRAASNETTQTVARTPEAQSQINSTPSSVHAIPQLQSSPPQAAAAAALPAASSGFTPEPESAPQHDLALWPWLLAALALGLGGAFLVWRNRSHEAFAGGPHLDLFSAPEPAPPPAPPPEPKTPVPAPIPRRSAPPVPGGVVSTRLRPWLEIALQPLRCIVEETRITFEFELELFNSGNAPARDVLVEASVFNAGPTQEQDIGAFFAQPHAQGERTDAIPPLQRMTLRSQVVAPRENVQVLAIAERQVFIPLIAFNALYRWSAAEGQTSASYLLGRDTKSAKMSPFRLDLGPRIFRGVGARLLPVGLRN
jgi:hypothetical protein